MKKWILLILVLALAISPAWAQKKNKKKKSRLASKEFQATTNNIELQNLSSINTPYLEFSPALYQNGLVFVTSRQQGGLFDEKLGETYFELFFARLDRAGVPFRPRPFSLEINTKYHEGPVSFTAAADRMFFTRNNTKDGLAITDEKGKTRLKIYVADRGPLDWENIRELPFNDNAFSCMHPTVTADGNRIYFSSNRKGGYGGMDLYVSEVFEGAWTEPINLGPDVNTPGNEVFPFIHPTGILFFASDGHRGLGGLDMFLMDISGKQWGSLVNMGDPFNSPEDDFGIIMNLTGDQGYFSSSRSGGIGKDDIYLFKAPDGLSGIKKAKQVVARIEVRDIETKNFLRGSQIRIFEKTFEGKTKGQDLYEMAFIPSADGQGNYKLEMRRKKGEELGQPASVVGQEGFSNISIDPGRQYVLLVSKEGYVSKEVKLQATGAEAYLPMAVELEKEKCVGLSGLATVVGQGRVVDGVIIRIKNSCTGEETIVRSGSDGRYSHCLETGCSYSISGEKNGFHTTTKSVSTRNLRGLRSFTVNLPLKVGADENANRKPIEVGSIIYVENITYDFNKSAIRTGAARDLEVLSQLMLKYPSLQVELGAHTDTRGETDYNQRLSEERANAAKQFLVDRGVAGFRINTKGYGETMPRNHCKEGVKCSDKEHAFNRRTEVKILRLSESVNVNALNEEIKKR